MGDHQNPLVVVAETEDLEVVVVETEVETVAEEEDPTLAHGQGLQKEEVVEIETDPIAVADPAIAPEVQSNRREAGRNLMTETEEMHLIEISQLT